MHRSTPFHRSDTAHFAAGPKRREHRPALRLVVLLLFVFSLPILAGTLLNINTATATELADQLPGIGPVKAQAIVAYREANGPFARVEDIVNVSGIGPATLAKLRPFISVTAAESASSPSTDSAAENAPIVALSQQQMELMARAATRAAIQMAVEDARGVKAR